MKSTLACRVAASGLALAPLAGAQEETPATPLRHPIYEVAVPPRIDGLLDDPCWETAVAYPVDLQMGKLDTPTESPSMWVKYAWDKHYLYIGYTVYDRNIWAMLDDRCSGPTGNRRQAVRYQDAGLTDHLKHGLLDVAEFFVSLGSHQQYWELHHNAVNGFSDIWVSVPANDDPANHSTLTRYGIHFSHQEFLPDDEGRDADGKPTTWRMAKAAHLLPKADGKPSTPNDASDEDVGWSGELRLPWGALNVPLTRQRFVTFEEEGRPRNFLSHFEMAGQELLLAEVLQNLDLPCRYTHSLANWKGGWFHLGVSAWRRHLLVPAEQP